VPDEFVHAVGSREHLLERYGITADGVAAAAVELLARTRAAETLA
jgi:hypothetical protein